MKKPVFLIIILLVLVTVISSCTEDDINVVDCNGLVSTKPVADIKKCINGKWKIIRSYNSQKDLDSYYQYIEFYQSDSLSWIYDDISRYTYSFDWFFYEDSTSKEEHNFIELNQLGEYPLMIFFLERQGDTLSITEEQFLSGTQTYVLVRSDDK